MQTGYVRSFAVTNFRRRKQRASGWYQHFMSALKIQMLCTRRTIILSALLLFIFWCTSENKHEMHITCEYNIGTLKHPASNCFHIQTVTFPGKIQIVLSGHGKCTNSICALYSQLVCGQYTTLKCELEIRNSQNLLSNDQSFFASISQQAITFKLIKRQMFKINNVSENYAAVQSSRLGKLTNNNTALKYGRYRL